MAENNNNVEKKYSEQFMPGVHRFGRLSMIIGAALSFLPVAYLMLVKGYVPTMAVLGQVVFAVAMFGIGTWITEPISYYPILGSASTYMGYLAGNVGNMRAPVAMAIQSTLGDDVVTPRGNIATIIGVAVSVFTNLIILLAIILIGSTALSHLPKPITASFSYALPALYASLLTMRFMNNPKRALSYIPVTIVVFLLATKVITVLSSYSTACCVGGTALAAYILFKGEKKKQGEE